MTISKECSQTLVFFGTLVALSGACVFVFAIFAASPAERDAGFDNDWHVTYVIGLLIASGAVECLCGMISPCCIGLLPALIASFFLLASTAIELAVAISLFDSGAAGTFMKSAVDSTQESRLRLFYTRFGTLTRSNGNSVVAILLIVLSILPMLILIVALIIRSRMREKPLLVKSVAYYSPNTSPQQSVGLQPITFPPNSTQYLSSYPPPPSPRKVYGVGCFFHHESDGSMSVSKFVEGGPAQLCRKIQVGDVLIAVNGVNVFRKSHGDLAQLLLGPLGSEVDLTFTRRQGDGRYTVRLSRLSDGSGRSPMKGMSSPPTFSPNTIIPTTLPTTFHDTSEAHVGVGIALSDDSTGTLRVSGLVPGGAAERSGQVHVGDRVIQIGGVAVRNETLASIQNRILGPPGSVVRVYLTRDPNPQAFAVDLVRQHAASTSPLPPNPALLHHPHDLYDLSNQHHRFPSTQSQVGGIGLVLNEALHGALYVTAVLPGGPASLAGIEVGSCLYTVDGIDVFKMPVESVNSMIKGPLNSTVVLGFRKGGSEQLAYVACLRTLAESGGSAPGGDTVVVPVEDMLKLQRSQYSVATGNPNELYGVGIFFHPDGDGGQMVGRLVPGGPAEATGRIAVGDRLYYVDGQSVYGKSVQQLAKYLLGRKGSFVRLGFKRERVGGRYLEVTVQRGASAEERCLKSFSLLVAPRKGRVKGRMFSGGGTQSNLWRRPGG